MTRDEFLAARKNGIGGSDCHHLFNIAPYGCQRALYYDKIDTPPDYPQMTTEPMERGTMLEPVIAAKWQKDHPEQMLSSGPMARHPEYQWATVNVDRWVHALHTNSGLRGMAPSGIFAEIKCPGREQYFRVVKHGLPEAYILQAQHGMFVTGAEHCLFIVFNADLWRYVDFTVDRDPTIIKTIKAAGDDVWDRIERRNPPPRLDAGSKQCRRCAWRTSCQGEALLASVDDEPEDIPFEEELAGLFQQYAELSELAEEAAALLDECKDSIRAAIGQRPVLEVPGFRAYYRPQTAKRLNEAKIVATLQQAREKLTLAMSVPGPEALLREVLELLKVENMKAPSVSRPLRIYAR